MLHCKKCEHLLLSNCEIGEMLFPVSEVPSCPIVPELWYTHRDCSGSESKLFFVRQQFLLLMNGNVIITGVIFESFTVFIHVKCCYCQ